MRLIERLNVQVLLEPESETSNFFSLAEHLRARFTPATALETEFSTNTPTPGTATPAPAAAEPGAEPSRPRPNGLQRSLCRLTNVQWQIVQYTDVPRSLTELMTHTGNRQRPHFLATHLEPLIAGGVLLLTMPDIPRSSRQRYVLSDTGLQLKILREQTTTSAGKRE